MEIRELWGFRVWPLKALGSFQTNLGESPQLTPGTIKRQVGIGMFQTLRRGKSNAWCNMQTHWGSGWKLDKSKMSVNWQSLFLYFYMICEFKNMALWLFVIYQYLSPIRQFPHRSTINHHRQALPPPMAPLSRTAARGLRLGRVLFFLRVSMGGETALASKGLNLRDPESLFFQANPEGTPTSNGLLDRGQDMQKNLRLSWGQAPSSTLQGGRTNENKIVDVCPKIGELAQIQSNAWPCE